MPCRKCSISASSIAGIVVVLSGLAMWKPVQLWWLAALFGGFDAARYVHFFAMAAIVGFSLIHIVMAFVVPKALRAIITGRKVRTPCRATARREFPASTRRS